jgi:outer membrane protein assembly factor BamB
MNPRSARRLCWFLLLLVWSDNFSVAIGQPFWPQFRGPNGQGVAESSDPPTTFSPSQNAIWSVEVPPGHSSPSIWGGNIFLSTFKEGILQCRAYERASGKLLWSRDVPTSKIERTHAFSNPAAPTSAADKEHVVFYFGSFGLLCFSPEGKELWRKELVPPVSRGNYGSASSPILVGDLVIQTLDTDEGGSRLLALNLSTGAKVWETPRPSLPPVGQRRSFGTTKANRPSLCSVPKNLPLTMRPKGQSFGPLVASHSRPSQAL